MYTVRQLRRMDTDFLRQHDDWTRKSGININNRAVHEHKALSLAFHYLQCYDQLNLPNLAGVETLVKRRSLIELAHKGHPDAPTYEGSEYYTGVRDSGDGSIIDPAAVKFTANKLSANAEIAKQSRKAREERDLVAGKGGGGKGEASGKPAGKGAP